MKKQFILMLGFVAIITLAIIEFHDAEAQLDRYKEYYNCTERLLDRLEGNLNWIDRFDDPAVDEYYNARENLLKQLRR